MVGQWILVCCFIHPFSAFVSRADLGAPSLTLLGFNLMYSQLSQIFPSKHVVMLAVFLFEIGSLICGVAPNMKVLIFGRAFAGLGAAGIFGGGMLVIAEITTLNERPKYFGLFGVV